MPPQGFRLETVTEIKRSRFITTLARANTEAQARALVAEVRSGFPDARHHCLAFILDEAGVRTARSSDDGEPAGTAGMPMLNSLIGAGLVNTCAIVTRYFGGIKLGASGLTRAYGNCVAEAAAQVPRVEPRILPVWRILVPHAEAGRIQEELLRAGGQLVSVDYTGSGVHLDFTADEPVPLVARISQGRLHPEPQGQLRLEVAL